MLLAILCIYKPLDDATTNISIDINLCMIKVSQRQAELLLLRKIIAKNVFEHCLVTPLEGRQMFLCKRAFDLRTERQSFVSTGEGRIDLILRQMSKSFLNMGEGTGLNRDAYRVFPFRDLAVHHGIQCQIQRPVETGLLLRHRRAVRYDPVKNFDDTVDPSWRTRSVLEDAKITIEDFPFQIGIGSEGSVCLGALVSQFQA